MTLSIHPSIGVARLGNSPGQFYLAPDQIGQLPFEADAYGNRLGPVQHFKDAAGQVRRQGQLFKLLTAEGDEVTLDSPNVKSIQWTVHLANKKAAWYQYSELKGNLLYGPQNSYKAQDIPFRNASVEGEQARRQLIIDPGPRSISGSRQSIGFDKANAPVDYPVSYPPATVESGTPVTTLGNLYTDDAGRLIVLGGFGHAGGNEELTSYGGSDSWHDDISDGPVYCTVTYLDGSTEQLQAWVVVGSPDFAPEIVNISTLSDTMFDVGVRFYNLVPELYCNDQFNRGFKANYQRDIQPLVERLSRYQWVANVQAMSAFNSRQFDYTDNSEANKANRQSYFSYFRGLNKEGDPSPNQPQQTLFKDNFPMLPLNSGSNSVSNELIMKFLALNETQQFLLSQWAEGHFDADPMAPPYPVHPLDQGSVGNCVGLPMCPGIEVTWSMQHPAVYAAPYRIADQKGPGGYNKTGLTPSRDECEGGGCEPGDLTKRMACPWQADFFQCTVQTVNFTEPEVNKSKGAPLPPTYYAYWWPPQSPWDVLTGELTQEGQAASHLPAGQQMNYARGINSFVQMVEHWSALAFIRNQHSEDALYPYFTETERNNELFCYKEVGIGQITGNKDDNETTIPVFYIETNKDTIKAKCTRAKAMVEAMEQRAFKPIDVSPDGLGMPRSGTRVRR
ncbi:CTQ-dependent lysine 6-oxidase LodA [Alkalimonas amylolytica]|uniref:L-lysine 6-oxidase n=1 Tax=Alkalimonas amylolytica TaxID=152573 RepID=A0A1H4BS78_ALKAM|nr:CTQ-dependent lysine 6-oxidase LodA [Alkalimonas amylolytica]SEA50959.1 L-lysine 6-oxidase [Alkalimonas amylolytica]